MQGEKIAKLARAACSGGPLGHTANGRFHEGPGMAQASDPGSMRYNLGFRMCWDAVIECAAQAKVISKVNAHQLTVTTSATNWTAFMPPDAPAINTARDMRNVPAGSFLGFFVATDGGEKLVHAMVATGHGFAAGTKNGCLGIGQPSGWEDLNLADILRWRAGAPGFVDHSNRVISIRFRDMNSEASTGCLIM